MNKAIITQYGGVKIRVLIAVVTLLVIGGVMFALLQVSGQEQQIGKRKALAISEYGLLIALQKIGEQPSWNSGFSKEAYEDGWYEVQIENMTEKDTVLLKIISIGHYESVSETRQCILRLDVSGDDSVWVRHSMY